MNATATEWDRDEALEAGRRDQDQAWILTDRGAWHKNPFYRGEPQPHPEADPAEWDTEG